MISTYSSLHNHTYYSLQDGYSSPKECLERAKEIGLKAFAITDHGVEYSFPYFDKIKKNYPDVKMIYGVEFYECEDMTVQDNDNRYYHLVVLAKNEEGRKALNKLLTEANFEGFYYKPRISIDRFKPYGKDLVISSACLASKLSREEDYNKCLEYIYEYKNICPHFYLEMQSHENETQTIYNKKILQLAKDTNTPYIITTDSHASTKEDLYYQGYLANTNKKDTDAKNEIYEGCYIQTVQEIHDIMDKQIGYNEVEIALQETNNIADLIEVVNLPFQAPKLPQYPLPEGFKDDYEFLHHLINKGWEDRRFDLLSTDDKKLYKERIDYELNIIHTMGFDGYFIIVWDFINWAKEKGIEIGAGRGSCSGSLICFAIGITNLNPIKYGLIFERFLNPERISMPDTDTDVSEREPIIEYLIDKYGIDKVCQVINFSFITPIVAIKDIGKVLGFKYQDMDKLSKKFTYKTFQECLENNEKFVQENLQYYQLFDICSHICGRVKTVSIHAGGVGITTEPITNYMAMKLGEKGEHVIQVDKRIIEEIGIVKFDILGVATLNINKWLKEDLGLSDWDIDINNTEFEIDNAPYDNVLNKALTNGVFQVESAGMKDILLHLSTYTIEELSDILALYRPDSMGELEHYIARKNGDEPITYIHPDMKPILEQTYGCLIYQEQLLEIVRKFAGRSYGGADLFRKAIGRKNKELVIQEATKLYQEIIDNGYDEKIARTISDELKEKGGLTKKVC